MGRAPCCEKVGLRRVKWSADEDRILTEYVRLHGEGRWRSLPKNAAGLLTCGKSCRMRWVNYLKDDVKRGNISAAEKELIVKLHAPLGNRHAFAFSYVFFDSESLARKEDNEIKNSWNSHLIRKIETFFIRRHHEEKASVLAAMECKKKGGRMSRRDMKKKNNSYFFPIVMASKAVVGPYPGDTASVAAVISGTTPRSIEEHGDVGEVGQGGTFNFHGMSRGSEIGMTEEMQAREAKTMQESLWLKMEGAEICGAASGSEVSGNDREMDDAVFQRLEHQNTMMQQLLQLLWEEESSDCGRWESGCIELLDLDRE